jgi:hypothetical protein
MYQEYCTNFCDAKLARLAAFGKASASASHTVAAVQNPKPTATGTDGDGTLLINRIWFTAGLAF